MKPAMMTKLNRFFADYPLHRYAQGEVVISADNTVPPVLYIVRGKICQYDSTESGTKAVLNIFQPPAFFPVMNALNQSPNTHYYEALTEVQARVIPPDVAVFFLKENPDVALDLLARLYRGVDGLLSKMTQLMAGTARSRLLFELAMAAERFGAIQPDGNCMVKFTEVQLAQQTGLARETVSRELQKLKKEGYLNLSKGRITILAPLPAPLPL